MLVLDEKTIRPDQQLTSVLPRSVLWHCWRVDTMDIQTVKTLFH